MSIRIKKVNQLLLKELANLLEQEFAGDFITIVDLETSKDLKKAKVWISCFGKEESDVIKKLEEKEGYFRSYLGKRLFIKNIPQLSFLIDKGSRQAARVEAILRNK